MIQSNRVGLTSAVGLIRGHRQTYSLRSHLLRKWHPFPVNGLPIAAHLIGRTSNTVVRAVPPTVPPAI